MSVAERLERIRSSIPIETSDEQRERLAEFRKPTVLYVDAKPLLRELVQAILGSDHRIHLVVAVDGAEALAEAQLHRPQLILLEVEIPTLNGYEVCAALRAREMTKDTTVVMVTARSERVDIDRGLAAGADHYLPKPFRYEDLVSRIEDFLGLKSSSAVA